MSFRIKCPICGNTIFPIYDYPEHCRSGKPSKVWFRCECGLRTPDRENVTNALKELERICIDTTSTR